MKKLISYVTACIMMLMVMVVPTYDTYGANLTIALSSSTVDIGDTLTVKVSAPKGITATVDVYFSKDLFQFISASGTTNVNGGTVTTTLGDPFSSYVNIKLKAKTTGTASIRATVIKAGDNSNTDENGNATSVTLDGASVNVTIANKIVEEPSTGNGNTDSGNTDSGNTDSGNTGSGNTGNGNTDSGNTGSGNTGSGNTGNGSTGSGNTGNGNTSSSQEQEKSADNSLSSLKISSGTLTPSFKYNVTKYKATVNYDVTKLVVSAKTSNPKATIESVTGNGNVSLKVGENPIKIIVKAENGVQATYTITVTRKEKETTVSSEKPNDSQSSEKPNDSQSSEKPQDTQVEETGFEYNGQKLNIIEEIPKEEIPTDFEKETLFINGEETSGLRFSKGELELLYLKNEAGYGSFYVYDNAQQDIYPFIKLTSEKNYVIVLQPSAENVPSGFVPCTISIEGKGMIQAYRQEEFVEEETQAKGMFGAETYFAAESANTDFYLIYCMNSSGELGWYQFDANEETFQRYHGTIDVEKDVIDTNAVPEKNYEEELKELKNKQKFMIGILGAVIVVLSIAVVSLTISKRKLSRQDNKTYVNKEDSLLEESEEIAKVNLDENIEKTVKNFDEFENEIVESEVEEVVDMFEESDMEFNNESMNEVEVEFFDMSEEILEQATADLKNEIEAMDGKQDTELELLTESEDIQSFLNTSVETIASKTNPSNSEDEDDDLEFIDL